MSEGRKKTLCKYFMSGACKKGPSCSFSHDRSNAPSKVCTFYLQGKCSYGSRCKFDHVKSKNDAKALPPPLVNSEVNNGASSSGLQTLTKNKLKYKGQEFVPGKLWAARGAARSCSDAASSYSAAARAGLPEEPRSVTCEHCSEVVTQDEEEHLENCVKFQEKEMEKAFKAKVSSDKMCGICLDVVWEKKPDSKKRFGILSHCNHIYCLDCIRTWRHNNMSEGETSRLCPECRTKSDFVLPSYHWFGDEAEKEKMIGDYKESLKNKPCRYFAKDQYCRFGDNCFYLHLCPDGSKGHNRRRFREDADGLIDIIDLVRISEFIDLYSDYEDDDDDFFDTDEYDDFFDYYYEHDSHTDSD